MAASLKPEEFELMPTLGDVARHHGRTRGEQVAMSFEGRQHDLRRTRRALEPGRRRADRRRRGAWRGDRLSRQEQRPLFRTGVRRGEGGRDHRADRLAALAGRSRLHHRRCAGAVLFVGPECIECARGGGRRRPAHGRAIDRHGAGRSHGLPVYEAWRDAQPRTIRDRIDVAPEDDGAYCSTRRAPPAGRRA